MNITYTTETIMIKCNTVMINVIHTYIQQEYINHEQRKYYIA